MTNYDWYGKFTPVIREKSIGFLKNINFTEIYFILWFFIEVNILNKVNNQI